MCVQGGKDTDRVLEGQRVMRRTTKRSTSGASQQEEHLKSGIVSKNGGGGVERGDGESREGKEGEAGGREHVAGLRLMHCDSHLEGFHFP